jgi:hypothetical protein
MMPQFRWFRAVVRIELRGLKKHRGRTMLVALLVGLPVAGLVLLNNL